MTGWLQDFRFGARMLARQPGTSIIAVVALSLGIGLTTVMFSIVQGVILRGLPFDQSENIMFLSRAAKATPDQRQSVPVDDYLDWSAQQSSFESLAAYTQTTVTVSPDSGYPERLPGARLTPTTLPTLRVTPIAGRAFTEADAAPGAAPVALIGYRWWQSRFGGDPQVVGQVVRLDGTPTTIIGILPEKFGFPDHHEIWMPLAVTRGSTRNAGQQVSVIGRLREGVSQERALTDMNTIAARLAAEYPENKNIIARVGGFIDERIPLRIRSTFYTMLAAVLGVMLIACVNVMNLQLARAADRSREAAIRTSLGAGRWPIVRQSLAEGLILAAIGAAIGTGIAQAGTTIFMWAIADTQPPFWIDVRLDLVVLAFVTVITVAAALVSSLVPGWRAARVDVNAMLKDEGRGATSLRMGRFGRWLVVAEVTISCVLLIVSGLMIRSIVSTSRLTFPFATRDVFYAQVSLGSRVGGDAAARARAIDDLAARAGSLPGVRRAALASGIPGSMGSSRVSVEGQTYATPDDRPHAMRNAVTPGFFETLRLTVGQGRDFDAGDVSGSPFVAIVDEAFVTRYLGGESALGRRLRVGSDEKAPWVTVVGVAPTVATPVQDAVEPTVYVPMAQNPSNGFQILAWTQGDPVAITSGVRTAAVAIDDQTTVSQPNTLAGQLWKQGWPFRVFGGLFLTFGAAALFLAAAGLYGVMAFTVRRRTSEIGVRMALGADRSKVLRMVLWQGLWRVGLGVALGIWPGWFVGTQMQALLSGVTAGDLTVHVTTVATMIVAGALACLGPALRAASVDPLTALRAE